MRGTHPSAKLCGLYRFTFPAGYVLAIGPRECAGAQLRGGIGGQRRAGRRNVPGQSCPIHQSRNEEVHVRGKLTLAVVGLGVLGACAGEKGTSNDSAAAAGAASAEAPVAMASPDSASRKPRTITVTMTLQCGDSTFVNVVPWTARLSKRNKDDIDFVLDSSSNVDDVDVSLKTASEKWPLADRPPYKFKKGRGIRKGLAASADTGKYAYNIVASCTVGGKSRKLVIDPDIFVD